MGISPMAGCFGVS